MSLPAPIAEAGASGEAAAREMKAAIKAIGRGETVAVERLRGLCRDHPAVAVEVIRVNLPRLARLCMDDVVAQSFDGALLARLEMLAVDLAGENPTLPVQLAAEVASFAWSEYWALAMHAALHMGKPESSLVGKRRTQSQRRYLAALKTVVQLRRLEGPIVVATQVNIGVSPG
jgi:hypothetical protein